MLNLAKLPPIGTTLLLDRQRYELRAVEPHKRQDGVSSVLLTWASSCPDCGSVFTVKTGLKANGINRRCVSCKKTGKPVVGSRSRKVKAVLRHV